ncbi:ABC transporter substrate-binding protein [Nesterenkonia halotolerans]|uniref:NitT/TauT family transport system substrate-binding protein n=1 Tax=Nesterenkonia halotolerans TaxID=225325 RepID=A0ABR9J9T6_9MICC|nr:ABC transporter substrate-binding protein [Nesterenkonia halotolerans]MBE1515637.1 NitT/TauT family transport system substrate-binding protein [Nesterenkonia halotolerans]
MKKNVASITGIAAISILALSACGSGSASGGDDAEAEGETSSEGGELTPITVGVLPIAPSVGIYYGIENGIFEEHGLDVELSTSNAGAAMLPAVNAQQLQFGIGNPNSVLNANDRGLDMRIVTGYSNSLPEGDDIAGVVSTVESGIEDWEDLEGNTVSVNALKTQGDLTIMESVEQAGGDPSAVEFSEMPFPDMPAQLEQGNTDAIWVPEPFLSSALADDANQLVGYSFQDAIPGMPTMVSFSSGEYVEENPEVAQAFSDAMTESLQMAEEDEEGTRALLPEFIDLPEEAAENLRMEELNAEIPTDEIEQAGALMVKFDFIEAEPDTSTLYFEGE